MFNFGLIVEQALGHITHYQNLKYWVSKDNSIQPIWMPVGTGTNDILDKLPVIRNNWSLQVSLRAFKQIKTAMKLHPDALFLHTQTTALFAIPFMHRIPTIISTDATPLNLDSIAAGYNHKVGNNYLAERSKFEWNKSTYKAATAIITFCEWAKNSLVHDYDIPGEKITVIPPGIDLEQWHFRQNKLVNCDSTNPLRLLFVGGDFARKGGYTLLEAFRNGLDQDCALDIVTKDTHIKDELTGIDNIRVHCDLTPNSQPLKQLYEQANIFVFPTQADCLPNAITEAMAAGLPIITTDVGALSEQVKHQVNGLIVPPSDVNALQNALQTLKNDQTKITAMGAASRDIAEQRFNAQRNYGEVFNLMKSISQKSRSQHSNVKSLHHV
ncbi:glycosyltransferase family 4 protein [Plectonema cf. radiosum LEGE 06105]|uniref:Glycosyltransferase family 4 protein n=1 Tax=Plectonema cf. radiosum LEGE 06105 TaxID=945769 RepID=A0A8J7FNV2_9CYAN|nr:glycosyltransferase family 4 protein [Plectonema radiosum]MBE9216596.1 glycosyltransferase family 4 protein [Plectonema cf. radiosum LEGE 06105]